MVTKEANPVIWRNLSIGSPDAETDTDLLDRCYVDNGCLELIRDTTSHASIVLGRTGQGKSAVLLRLRSVEPHVIELRPIELAFRFVENSTVISFFEEAGVNLNLFYRLLWRHVLVTELIKHKFQINDQGAVGRWLDDLLARFRRDSGRTKALNYLRRWGENFWEETEVRLTEVTKKIESELTSSLEGSALAMKVGAGAAARLSDSERAEVVSRGSAVVNRIQIADLNRVMEILAEEAFEDPQDGHFITIDCLDEDWVSNSSKYRLIRALIEEVRTFRGSLRNAKVIVALRSDLIERVFELTRDGGFQEEKYETYYARLHWTREDLLSLLKSRVNEVFKRRYTKAEVTIEDVFPKPRHRVTPYDYILDRTLARPRDVIAFANECFVAAVDRSRVSWKAIAEAEIVYSRKRKGALIDEWLNTLPSIETALEVLRDLPWTISRSSLSESKIDSVIVHLATLKLEDDLVRLCKRALEAGSSVTHAQLVSAIIQVLYHVGAIGVKSSAEAPFLWAFKDQASITSGEAKRVISIKVHKMLWRALEIRGEVAYRQAAED